jgi:hypothetical protein
MGIARRELAPGIANTDHRLTPELFIGNALVLHPGPVDKPVFTGSAKPIL